jgi:hypothetical protein
MPLPCDCRFAFLLKTYAGDLEFACRLIDTYLEHNVEHIPLVISCPAVDRPQFARFESESVSVISDEEVTDQLVTREVAGIRPGYINQEIVKLAFAEKGIARNYMCLDSDGVFLRDFGYADFMFDQDTPYTVMFEDNELRTDRDYFDTHWSARAEAIERIRVAVGLSPRPLLTCHGFAILSSAVLEVFRRDFMAPRGLGYADLLEISPYEFSWYTLYLQATEVIDIHPRESLFRYVHSSRQYSLLTLSGATLEDIGRGYVGLTINSNFSRDFGIAELGEPIENVLGRYVSFRTLGAASLVRLKLGVHITLSRLVARVR